MSSGGGWEGGVAHMWLTVTGVEELISVGDLFVFVSLTVILCSLAAAFT